MGLGLSREFKCGSFSEENLNSNNDIVKTSKVYTSFYIYGRVVSEEDYYNHPNHQKVGRRY